MSRHGFAMLDVLYLAAGAFILGMEYGWKLGAAVWLVAQAIRPVAEVD